MKSSKLMPILLMTCIAIVVVWEVAANRSRRPFSSFTMTSADFAGFLPKVPGWSIEHIAIAADDPSAPNLAAYMVKREDGKGIAVLVRLVHGYNMHDCMRLKGYKVELMADSVESGKWEVESKAIDQPLTTNYQPPTINHQLRIQTWRLISDIGDRSISCSTMLRAVDFGGTMVDVRDMAFPRIAGVIGPEGEIVGLKASSLSHPVQSLVMLCKVKWNNSRCDLLTFLKLRQPAWASTEYLTFLASSRGVRVTPGDEARVISEVRAAQAVVYAELCRWKRP